MIDKGVQKASVFIQQMNALFGRTRIGGIVNEYVDFFDLLLSKSSHDVNKLLRQYLVRTLASSRYIRSINSGELYVVFYDGGSYCLRGDELLNPDIKIPSYSEIFSEHIWYQKTGYRPKIAEGYKTVDDLIEARITSALKMINFLRDTLESGVSPWDYVHLSTDGQKIKEELICLVGGMINQTEADIKIIEENEGPAFLLDDYRKDLRRNKIISRCLTKTVIPKN